MIIDNRTLLFNGHSNFKGAAKKSLQTSIGNTSVASTEHKSINLGLENQNSNQNGRQNCAPEKNQYEETIKSTEINTSEKLNKHQKDNKELKIIRDPLVLLKAF